MRFFRQLQFFHILQERNGKNTSLIVNALFGLETACFYFDLLTGVQNVIWRNLRDKPLPWWDGRDSLFGNQTDSEMR